MASSFSSYKKVPDAKCYQGLCDIKKRHRAVLLIMLMSMSFIHYSMDLVDCSMLVAQS